MTELLRLVHCTHPRANHGTPQFQSRLPNPLSCTMHQRHCRCRLPNRFRLQSCRMELGLEIGGRPLHWLGQTGCSPRGCARPIFLEVGFVYPSALLSGYNHTRRISAHTATDWKSQGEELFPSERIGACTSDQRCKQFLTSSRSWAGLLSSLVSLFLSVRANHPSAQTQKHTDN